MSASARRLRNLFFVVLGLLVPLNVFIYPHDPHFGLDRIPGFWSLFGLAGAVILARGAKGLAHTVLGKDENFYEKGSEDSRGQGAK
jgi:NhaP-type Na+/H+ or K+/H+ antiporter